MSDKDTGGPAFPLPELNVWEGMTLRDAFAIGALPAVVGQESNGISAYGSHSTLSDGTTLAKYWAGEAYAIADAMLLERAK